MLEPRIEAQRREQESPTREKSEREREGRREEFRTGFFLCCSNSRTCSYVCCVPRSSCNLFPISRS